MSSTQIFGGGRSGLTSTQLFAGSAPGAGAQTPIPNTTQVFGAGTASQPGGPRQPAPAPQGAGRGPGPLRPPPPAIPPLGSTQVFGAAPAQGPVGSSTQTFGVAPAQGHTAPGGTTQTFGAVAGPGQTTQNFGSLPAQGQAAPGQPAQPPGLAPSRGAPAPGQLTQTFGAVPAQGGTPPVQASQPGSVPAHDAPAAASMGRTQAFSAAPAKAAGAVPPQSAPSGAHPAHDAPAPIGVTRAFGVAPSTPPSAPPPQERTQSFGAVPSEEPAIPHTALFGSQAGAGGQTGGVRLPPEAPPPVGSETLLPFGPGPSHPPVSAEPGTGSGPASRRAPVELPPELLAASRASSSIAVDAGPERRPLQRVLAVLGVVAGLVLAGVLAYPAWRDRNADMPVAAVEDKDRAAVLLLRDDTAARDQAIQRLRALISTHPRYTEAQAELVVALSLRLADLQAEAVLLRDQVARARADLDTLSGVDRERRAGSLQQEVEQLKTEEAQLQPRIQALRKELAPLVAALADAPEAEPLPALEARMKARAFHAGVTAAPEALGLAERLRKVEGSPKTWSTLARAEYALSAGSPPASLAEVARELENLRNEESSLRRAYVLGARLALRLNDPATARALLDDAVALNPNHELARKLLSQLDANAPSP